MDQYAVLHASRPFRNEPARSIDAPAWHTEHFPISSWPRTAARRASSSPRGGCRRLHNRCPGRNGGHIVELGGDWTEGRLTAASKVGAHRRKRRLPTRAAARPSAAGRQLGDDLVDHRSRPDRPVSSASPLPRNSSRSGACTARTIVLSVSADCDPGNGQSVLRHRRREIAGDWARAAIDHRRADRTRCRPRASPASRHGRLRQDRRSIPAATVSTGAAASVATIFPSPAICWRVRRCLKRPQPRSRPTAALPLPRKLIAALMASEAAGGDKRGKRSASLVICGKDEWSELDVRVDDYEDPLLLRLARLERVSHERWVHFTRSSPADPRQSRRYHRSHRDRRRHCQGPGRARRRQKQMTRT